VKKLLQQGSIESAVLQTLDDGPDQEQINGQINALKIWHEAQPIEGTLGDTYLIARGCSPLKGKSWTPELRFHSTCPFGSFFFPAWLP
jgi:hypothetical protein